MTRVNNSNKKARSSSSNLIHDPGQWDILCGKTKSCMMHPGTQRFRMVIESYRERYAEALTKYDKMTVTKEIYEALQVASSRFLKWTSKENAWEELTPMAARDKCGHALRFANRENRMRVSATTTGSLGQSFSRSSSPSCLSVASLPLPPHPKVEAAPLKFSQSVPVLSNSNLTSMGSMRNHVRRVDDDDEDEEETPAHTYSTSSTTTTTSSIPAVVTEETLFASTQSTMRLVGETVALLDSVRHAQSFEWDSSAMTSLLSSDSPPTSNTSSASLDVAVPTSMKPSSTGKKPSAGAGESQALIQDKADVIQWGQGAELEDWEFSGEGFTPWK